MGKRLGWWVHAVFWNFTPEQVQNPEKLVEYLEKVCCRPGNSRETEIVAMCWGLGHGYQALLNTIQYHQGKEKVSRSDNKPTGTVATPTPARSTRATPTPATGTAAEVKKQPMLVSITPVYKKKYTKKSFCLVRDDNEPGSSREQEEEPEPEVITQSLSLRELREMQKDFGHHPGEHIVTWLLQCWDNGAGSLESEGREAKQLGSLSREGGIDKAIGKRTQALSLWR
ncbi:hypothetical protein GRJ2_000867000 [Grus japonensis]|uniref:Uncharacterized protein n=1 Tax=Grus japonensis TaxID=30415 RepID=A0ABC9WH67_GRUJA